MSKIMGTASSFRRRVLPVWMKQASSKWSPRSQVLSPGKFSLLNAVTHTPRLSGSFGNLKMSQTILVMASLVSRPRTGFVTKLQFDSKLNSVAAGRRHEQKTDATHCGIVSRRYRCQLQFVACEQQKVPWMDVWLTTWQWQIMQTYKWLKEWKDVTAHLVVRYTPSQTGDLRLHITYWLSITCSRQN